MATKTRIVRIGNSRGIRVPKILLEQAQLPDEVELHAEPGRLVVQASRRPRTGWAEAARAMSEHEHDGLLDESTATRFGIPSRRTAQRSIERSSATPAPSDPSTRPRKEKP